MIIKYLLHINIIVIIYMPSNIKKVILTLIALILKTTYLLSIESNEKKWKTFNIHLFMNLITFLKFYAISIKFLQIYKKLSFYGFVLSGTSWDLSSIASNIIIQERGAAIGQGKEMEEADKKLSKTFQGIGKCCKDTLTEVYFSFFTSALSVL